MSESKPRVYYAVWEDASLNDDDSVDEDGFCAGAISTHGGGNLHWDENQFQVVHKDDYDALKLENERFREELTKLLMKSGTEINMLNALTDQQKRALGEYSSLVQAACEQRDRALEMLKKMAGALDEFDAANIVGDFDPRDRKSKEAQRWRDRWEAARENLTAVAELYRKEFGEKK